MLLKATLLLKKLSETIDQISELQCGKLKKKKIAVDSIMHFLQGLKPDCQTGLKTGLTRIISQTGFNPNPDKSTRIQTGFSKTRIKTGLKPVFYPVFKRFSNQKKQQSKSLFFSKVERKKSYKNCHIIM